MISDVAKTIGYVHFHICSFDLYVIVRFNETVATIIPLIGPLSKDVAPVVKQHLVEQLKTLAEVIIVLIAIVSLILL